MQKKFLLFISVMTGCSLVAFFIVLLRLDPCLVPAENGCADPSVLALWLFFLSVFFSLVGVFTLVGFFFRRQMQGEFFYDQMGVSLRQGVLLSLTAVLCLLFFLYGVLTWWSGFLLLTIIVLIELYFTARA